MESKAEFYEVVEGIAERDPRYKPEAYSFLMLALNHTVALLDSPRHVSGQELLVGIRDYAIDQFGPMAKTVFHHWGVNETRDFGHIVFNLVQSGLLGKTDSDRIEDFTNGFDFETAFVTEYPWGVQPEGKE